MSRRCKHPVIVVTVMRARNTPQPGLRALVLARRIGARFKTTTITTRSTVDHAYCIACTLCDMASCVAHQQNHQDVCYHVLWKIGMPGVAEPSANKKDNDRPSFHSDQFVKKVLIFLRVRILSLCIEHTLRSSGASACCMKWSIHIHYYTFD